ncbi:hypothetical protein [Cupriavidus sp. AU9028]|uniref:hypothetical protein n=1 Tax=Cupriavidus sp. AU9028 TaxID=2871157 RepID=UPI001C952342|nr:hypothetical protein [Cupriavidus sp. AU9028]MBY4898689.1 hypothetical protein [Cupriavidus sp. AU9028]
MSAVAADTLLKATPIETKGKTIFEVAAEIRRQLRLTGLDPEWFDPANFMNDENESLYGPKSSSRWPELRTRERLAISVHRGFSEGWGIFVDRVGYAGGHADATTTAEKLLVGKSLTQRDAWEIAKALSTMLETC